MFLCLREVFINTLIKVIVFNELVLGVCSKQLTWNEFFKNLALELFDDILTIDSKYLLLRFLLKLFKFICFLFFLLLCFAISCYYSLLRIFFLFLLAVCYKAFYVFKVLHTLNH